MLLIPPSPPPTELPTRLHAEVVASPLVGVNGSSDKGLYPDSSSEAHGWLLGARGFFGFVFTPRLTLDIGAGYRRTRWQRTAHSIDMLARLSWLPLDLERRAPTRRRPRSVAGAYFGFGPAVTWEPPIADSPDPLLSVGMAMHVAPTVRIQLDRRAALSFSLEAGLGMRNFGQDTEQLRDAKVLRTSLSLVVGGSFGL